MAPRVLSAVTLHRRIRANRLFQWAAVCPQLVSDTVNKKINIIILLIFFRLLCHIKPSQGLKK